VDRLGAGGARPGGIPAGGAACRAGSFVPPRRLPKRGGSRGCGGRHHPLVEEALPPGLVRRGDAGPRAPSRHHRPDRVAPGARPEALPGSALHEAAAGRLAPAVSPGPADRVPHRSRGSDGDVLGAPPPQQLSQPLQPAPARLCHPLCQRPLPVHMPAAAAGIPSRSRPAGFHQRPRGGKLPENVARAADLLRSHLLAAREVAAPEPRDKGDRGGAVTPSAGCFD
jgi:hypothetical protein